MSVDYECCEPVEHRNDRFDGINKQRRTGFPVERKPFKRRQPGIEMSEADLRIEAHNSLRAKNRKLNGKRGAGHVALVSWGLRLTVDKDGNDRVSIYAEGYRHKTFERLEASTRI